MLTEVISSVGPILAVCTLGTRLLNAAGAAPVGLARALIGWGISDEDAKFDKFLVTVERDTRTDDVTAVFTHHSGYDRGLPPHVSQMTVKTMHRVGRGTTAPAASRWSYHVGSARQPVEPSGF